MLIYGTFFFMLTMIEEGPYACLVLGKGKQEKGEFLVYYEASVACLFDDDDEARKRLAAWQEKNPDLDFYSYELWAELFVDNSLAHFVLLKKPEGADKTIDIIGVADIFFDPEGNDPPELSNRHILKKERGKGLSALLYKAQLDYLAKFTADPEVQIFIEPTNTRNLRAAARHGFVKMSDELYGLDGEKKKYWLFKRSLDDLRPQRKSSPGSSDAPNQNTLDHDNPG